MSEEKKTVRSFLDDDHLDHILANLKHDDVKSDVDNIEELFDVGDEPFEPRNKPARQSAAILPEANPPAAARPSPTAAPAKDEEAPGGKRIEVYRALQCFTQAMNEAAPLFLGEKRRNPSKDHDELMQSVGQLCGKHLGLIDQILKINQAGDGFMLRYQKRSLAQSIASLYEKYSFEDLSGLVELAQSWAMQSADFETPCGEHQTDDGWLTVKLNLFTASLTYHDELDGMWCSHTPSEVMMELQRVAIQLAKEVAFSWSKRSQISDRDSLFSTALPHCLKIAQTAYSDCVLAALGGQDYNPLSTTPELPTVMNMVDELNMGYEEGELRDGLLRRMQDQAVKYITGAKAPRLRQDDLVIWKAALLEEVDKMFAFSWEDAANELMDELEDLSEDEQNEYYEKHDVMDFSRFESKALERLTMVDRPGRLISINFDEVLAKAKKSLAWIWGVSDSLVAARKESTPGD